MRPIALIAAAAACLAFAGCGKSTKATAAGGDPAEQRAAANAAAEASQVTSIPGYTPDTGNAPR